ncbi:MAG: aminoacyl-tRNA hydrolase [Candidatus Yonathbacteria bacterium]|nr:aminoacyl-tRNA hydrolase [Candidatus Yonathbacteria bacterium]
MERGYIIVGLGNPGEEYASTPHNAGRMVIERFAETCGCGAFRKERVYRALVADGTLRKGGDADGIHVTLVMPETYMNESGKSVAPFFSLPEDVGRLIVVQDDIDLPLGTVRVSQDRGTGGHKGVASIVAETGTNKFIRVRVGIAPTNLFGQMYKPTKNGGVPAYVVAPLSSQKKKRLDEGVARAVLALTAILTEGVVPTMNTFN